MNESFCHTLPPFLLVTYPIEIKILNNQALSLLGLNPNSNMFRIFLFPTFKKNKF